jgi:hypothetical protein
MLAPPINFRWTESLWGDTRSKNSGSCISIWRSVYQIGGVPGILLGETYVVRTPVWHSQSVVEDGGPWRATCLKLRIHCARPNRMEIREDAGTPSYILQVEVKWENYSTADEYTGASEQTTLAAYVRACISIWKRVRPVWWQISESELEADALSSPMNNGFRDWVDFRCWTGSKRFMIDGNDPSYKKCRLWLGWKPVSLSQCFKHRF